MRNRQCLLTITSLHRSKFNNNKGKRSCFRLMKTFSSKEEKTGSWVTHTHILQLQTLGLVCLTCYHISRAFSPENLLFWSTIQLIEGYNWEEWAKRQTSPMSLQRILWLTLPKLFSISKTLFLFLQLRVSLIKWSQYEIWFCLWGTPLKFVALQKDN